MSYLEGYDIVIGLEIHAELNTQTKVFCSCKNEFGAAPNSNTCPVCTGMPGALPILKRHAVELAIKAGLSFGCEISHYSVFERKNYFYPEQSLSNKPACLSTMRGRRCQSFKWQKNKLKQNTS